MTVGSSVEKSAIHTKQNASPFPDALYREAEGLALLKDAILQTGSTSVRVPDVFLVNESCIRMTAVRQKRQTSRLLYRLGETLGQIHQLPHHCYGFERDNYIGLSPQLNIESDSWGHFFVEYRLRYQVSRIGHPDIRERFEKILEQSRAGLTDWLDTSCRRPSLLHGDLWSGNALFDDECAWLIDPAVYYGDREADIAMTEMFGGFGPAFYEGYYSVCPKTPSYTRKREIYNLYHYLNHYNLFGGWYLEACQQTFGMIERNFSSAT